MDMQAAQYGARLWLQTDAAFGLREVPLALPKPTVSSTGKITGRPVQTATVPGRSAYRPAPPVAPRAVAPPTPPSPARAMATPPAEFRRPAAHTLAGSQGADIPRTVKLPPIPDVPIDALEAISAADKASLLAELQQQVIAALTPHLSEIATKVVFGDGDPAAKLMFVGEGPGIEEDRTGIPFVGRSGQLLDKMIVAMGLNRKTVYIGNVVKLRAAEADPDTGRLRDRPPTPAEVALNIPWLHRQIEIIRPRVIVTLGAPALKYLTGTTEGISRLRGTWMTYRGVPLMPTYHPSFLLRAYTPENRAKGWGDLQQVMTKLGLPPAQPK